MNKNTGLNSMDYLKHNIKTAVSKYCEAQSSIVFIKKNPQRNPHSHTETPLPPKSHAPFRTVEFQLGVTNLPVSTTNSVVENKPI